MTTSAPRPARGDLADHWSLDPAVAVLNHGSFGACPTEILAEQTRLRTLIEANPTGFYFNERPALWRQAIEVLARFMNADPAGLAFETNATAAVNTVLKSLTFQPGDEILVIDHAYQACRNTVELVAAKSGARVMPVALPFPPESEEQVVSLILAAVTSRTRLAMIDAVTSPTALRLPFERLTHELEGRGVDVLLDAAHGVGIVPLDVGTLGAAYVVTNCHKWLCTPKAAGVLWVRADRRHLIRPLITSHGFSAGGEAPERFRVEHDWPGTIDPTPWLCVPKAIEYLGGLVPGGWPGIMARNHALAIEARDLLSDAVGATSRVPDGMIASMTTIAIAPDADAKRSALTADPLMTRLLAEYGIQVVVFSWPMHRARYLRVSAALYNGLDEYRFLASALTELGVRA